jgi:drug/metabolite transporter (DMT)-like permease
MIDALLLLMAIIWGTNYSIVKFAFQEVDPQAFNAARMLIASTVPAIIGVLRLRPTRVRRARPGGIEYLPTPDA